MRTLAQVDLGTRVVVTSVAEHEHARLARHGVVCDVELVCTQDAPLHGPRIVDIGARRLAIPRSLASNICVELVTDNSA